MADDVRGQTVGPPAYSYAAPQFDGQMDEVVIYPPTSEAHQPGPSQQHNEQPPLPGFILPDKPPPYPGLPADFAASNQYVLNTTAYQPPPSGPPSYPGFPPEQQIIMHTAQQSNVQTRQHGTLVIAERQYMPPTQMCLSCTVLWLCFLPLGFVAFIYSSMVKPRFARGDYQGAISASRSARVCGNLGFFVGTCLWTALLLYWTL